MSRLRHGRSTAASPGSAPQVEEPLVTAASASSRRTHPLPGLSDATDSALSLFFFCLSSTQAPQMKSPTKFIRLKLQMTMPTRISATRVGRTRKK
jgi:hypothetical protein